MISNQPFKYCNCQQTFPDISEARLHQKWFDVRGVKHTVVPIQKCLFCHGCDGK